MLSEKYLKLAEKYKVTWDSEADEPEVIKYLDEVSARDEKRAASMAEFEAGVTSAEAKKDHIFDDIVLPEAKADNKKSSDKDDKSPELLKSLEVYI